MTLRKVEASDTKVSSVKYKQIAQALGVVLERRDSASAPIREGPGDFGSRTPSSFFQPSDTLDEIGNQFRTYAQQSPDEARQVVDVIRQLSEIRRRKQSDPFFHVIADSMWKDTVYAIAGCAVGHAVIPDRLIPMATSLLTLAKKSVAATSLLIPSHWWLTEEGRMYHSASMDITKKGQAKVTRLFFLEQAELSDKDILEVLNEQTAAGNEVMVGHMEEIKARPWISLEDIIIIDDKFAARMPLNLERQGRIQTYTRLNLDDSRRKLQLLRDMCKPWLDQNH